MPPDPISGAHCWHQAVRVKPAEPGDRYGDIVVDTARSQEAFRDWLTARQDDNAMPIDETAKLGAAVVKRIYSVGMIRLAVVMLPVPCVLPRER